METEIFQVNGYLTTEEAVQLLKSLPKLSTKDISDAVLYVLSTPPNVQVFLLNCQTEKSILIFLQVTELTIRPVGEMA